MYKDGWKVHMLTKKELCHSNETWHALNSTFPDTNCIVSFQTKPHWISNSGLWKVVLETFREWPGKLPKGVPFYQDNAPAHSGLLCVTVAWKWLITLHILLICHHLFSVPQHENNKIKTLGWEVISDRWAEKQYRTDEEVIIICSWELFGGSRWELLYHGNPSAATPMEEVCGPQGETILKNKPDLSNSTS